MQTILKHVGDMGWENSAWSDDLLAAKKIYPRHQFASKSKKWLPRVKTCDESMHLLVRRVQSVHCRTPEYIRKKMEPNAMENLAERSAAVWQVAQEIKLASPIADPIIMREWLDAWAGGSEHIDTEIQVAQGGVEYVWGGNGAAWWGGKGRGGKGRGSGG